MIETARRRLRALVAEDLRDPRLSYRAIAIRRRCTERLVGDVASEHGLVRRLNKAAARCEGR